MREAVYSAIATELVHGIAVLLRSKLRKQLAKAREGFGPPRHSPAPTRFDSPFPARTALRTPLPPELPAA
jgi:hypothetical protein